MMNSHPKPIKASFLAALTGAQLEGNPEKEVFYPSTLENATPQAVSFLANPKYADKARQSKAGVLVVDFKFQPFEGQDITFIRSSDPYLCFANILEYFFPTKHPSPGIEPGAYVSPTVQISETTHIGFGSYISDGVEIGEHCVIYPQVFLGSNVKIGANAILYPGVKIYHDCVIGNHCVIHAGSIIGADGFGFAPQADGTFRKIPQTGIVQIGDFVEIGANACIDRAAMGATIIHNGVKIDNLVMIAHNVQIGENTAIAGQAGISGSTKIGRNCMIGGQSGFVGHIEIADRSQFGAQSGVQRNIHEAGKRWNGTPVMEYMPYQKSQVIFRNLPQLEQRLSHLESQWKSSNDPNPSS